MHSILIEDVLLSIFSTILCIWCYIDPNPDLANVGRHVPEKGDIFFHGALRSKYIFTATSAFDICMGYYNQVALDLPVAQRLRTFRRLGFSVLLCGAAFRYWAIRELGRFFTLRLVVRKDHKVVRTGPFAFVRHPSYIGAQTVAIGELIFLLTGNVARKYFATGSLPSEVAIFILPTITAIAHILLIPRIEREEKMLSEAFGEEWKSYTREVKWKLLPGIF